jgi:hypothetical protein
MEIEDIITLDNNENYLLLMVSELTDEKYFLSVKVDDNDEPLGEYVVLQEITKNGETLAKKINNPELLSNLISDFQLQYKDEYDNN